jgi:geranylgeranylglycerol-phosphate geranylgeranyltransferase
MVRHGYRALLHAGGSYLRDVASGRTPILQVAPGVFARELGLALRPHFFAFSALAALAGAAAASGSSPPSCGRTAVAAGVSGVGWGVGQIVNDLMDQDADRVNAPSRAIVSGRLPAGPALGAAILLGAMVAVATVFVHPAAWIFAAMGVALLLGYNVAKRIPGAGNLAHGALMAVAAAIGTLSTVSHGAALHEVLEACARAAPAWCVVAAVAGWYLQANYEKDRPGDRAAGYLTAATVFTVRASAALRALGIVGIAGAAYAAGLLPDAIARASMAFGVVLGLCSTWRALRDDSDAAALRGYRAAVDATLLCLLALAAPVLGALGSALGLLAAVALVHAAFHREANP